MLPDSPDFEFIDPHITDNPHATYFAVVRAPLPRIEVLAGDVLTIDCAKEPISGNKVLARIYGNRFVTREWPPPYLISLTEDATHTLITPEMNLRIVGVVTSFTRYLGA